MRLHHCNIMFGFRKLADEGEKIVAGGFLRAERTMNFSACARARAKSLPKFTLTPFCNYVTHLANYIFAKNLLLTNMCVCVCAAWNNNTDCCS